ncbi:MULTISPECIES: MarR family winged helix-turn-helix transcriptional regulator [Apilactobacillus]|uniref:HTH-type transcriptional regulator SarZ n=2 Tax=Apilactobacillus TaxID=2767877 RepID=A0A9Q8INB8_9LACO|nr:MULTISPECIES: MarR family transcriptional regulator [Apilactobacillus]TPR14804.1 MarR family transcriptional regulator [Apilactobacillus timberlakei]TPR15771.1 MarR family transcriptional regulator [Apilactobacillus timberlakei]TPR16132.1 MarR family transcriptional regulator [Apilactobacillus timberlakei]TPR18176.1 MarR family transcriptional regulator [Apilactobacillus timberlakei]TPR18879.1 MarR family transcriptional regulator [Apilactobacillus timberlakei]
MTNKITLDNQICFQITRAHQLFNKFYQEPLSKFNLTYVQYITLLSLWEKDGVTVNYLSQKLGLSNGTLTPLLKRLEKAGWITRTRDKKDERRVLIKLTEHGAKQEEPITSTVQGCLNSLDYDDKTFNNTMNTILDVQNRLEKSEEAKENS